MGKESNEHINARIIHCLISKLSKLYPQPDCIEDDGTDNEDEIQQSNQHSSDNWESTGAKKLFGYSTSYIPTEKEDDINDEDIESIVLQ
jgi:hypothetical protein